MTKSCGTTSQNALPEPDFSTFDTGDILTLAWQPAGKYGRRIAGDYSWPANAAACHARRTAAGERDGDVAGVTGSIPVTPAISCQNLEMSDYSLAMA
jgi:hypothetical protein